MTDHDPLLSDTPAPPHDGAGVYPHTPAHAANGSLAAPSADDDAAVTPLAVAPVPAALTEPAPPPPERGEQVFVDVWDAHARATAPMLAAQKRRSSLTMARELVETLALALVIFLGVRAVVQNFRVEGSSMDPTYASGQYVLVSKALYAHLSPQTIGRFLPFISSADTTKYLFRGPKRGEVIVFRPPLPNSADRDFIKRVIGLPGDRVQVKDGKVFVNDQQLAETYLRPLQTACGGQWCDVRLGANEYYVMGDNRGNSSDSRIWGPVQADKIIGKTWLIYLPLSDFGRAPNQAPGTVAAASATATPSR